MDIPRMAFPPEEKKLLLRLEATQARVWLDKSQRYAEIKGLSGESLLCTIYRAFPVQKLE
jgi:hypothetical protein